MKSEYEKLIVYTDVLENTFASAHMSGQMSAYKNKSYEEMEKASKEYAAEKIKFYRECISESIVVPRFDYIKNQQEPAPEPTVDSLIDMGFGTTEDKKHE